MSQIKGKKQIFKLTVDDQHILIEMVRLHPAIYFCHDDLFEKRHIMTLLKEIIVTKMSRKISGRRMRGKWM